MVYDPKVTLLPALLVAVVVQAATGRSASLDWIRERGGESCPDALAMQRAIAVRLGYDPFTRGSGTQLKATVTGEVLDGGVRRWRGTIELAGGHSDVTADGPDCSALAQSMALTITIAIDPLVLTRPPPAPDAGHPTRTAPAREAVVDAGPLAPPDAGAPELRVEPLDAGPADAGAAEEATLELVLPQRKPPRPITPRADLPEERALKVTAGGGLDVGIGLAAGASLGVRAELGLRFESWSVLIEAHADYAPPAHLKPATRSVAGALFFGLLALCLNPGDVSLCALAGGGAMQSAPSGVSQPLSVVTPLALAGARAAYDIPLGERVRLRAAIDVYARLVRVQLTIDGTPAWTSGLLSGSFGLSVLSFF